MMLFKNVNSFALLSQSVINKYETECHHDSIKSNVKVTERAGKNTHHIHDANANAALTVNVGNTPHHFEKEIHTLTQHIENSPPNMSQINAPLNIICLKFKILKIIMIIQKLFFSAISR